MADPDQQEYERQQATEQRRRMAEIDQVKQTIEPLVQSASNGGWGVSPDAGQAMLNAIHKCQDRLAMARSQTERIQQNTMLGTSPDAVVMTRFNRQVGLDGATALMGLQEILVQAETAVTEAMRHYRQMDEHGAAGITRAGH